MAPKGNWLANLDTGIHPIKRRLHISRKVTPYQGVKGEEGVGLGHHIE